MKQTNNITMSVKNISFKIVLLLLFILMAVGAVLVFVNTIAENPPESSSKTENGYIEDINSQIGKLNDFDIDSLK